MEDDDLDAKDEEYMLSNLKKAEIEDTLKKAKKDISTLRSLLRNLEASVSRIESVLETLEEED